MTTTTVLWKGGLSRESSMTGGMAYADVGAGDDRSTVATRTYALNCSACTNPAPWFLTILQACP
ncbi:MAG TPA: hypothetical protein VI197_20640 [Polyangiaceae bacterium]